MRETIVILRRHESNSFDDYVAFKLPPAAYYGWMCSDVAGLARSIAWYGDKSKSKEFPHELLFPQDIAGVVVPEKMKVSNSTFHVFTDEEKISFMKMFNIHREDFLKHIATR